MGAYDNNPIIEGRFDALGRKTYWNQGYRGQGVKVAVIDDYTVEHGWEMANDREYISPECALVKLDMKGDNYWNIYPLVYEAIKQGANIISISRSADSDIAPMWDAVKAAKAAGVIVFCSAGNSGDEFRDYVDIKRYPAAYPETISVMSINNNYTFSSFASHNSMADITSFGQNVLVKNSKGEEVLVSGTSPSTAQCAFTAALHWCKILKETGKHPTWDYMMNFVKTNVVDLNEVGRDNFTGNGFFTLDKDEFARVKLMILDKNNDGLEDRVGEIKALIKSGMSYEQAERQVSSNYYIVGYEMINGAKVPVYGGRKY